jgi:hypothetical protein
MKSAASSANPPRLSLRGCLEKEVFPHYRDAPWGVSKATHCVARLDARGRVVADRTALSASETPHGASLQWVVDGMPLSRHPLRGCRSMGSPKPAARSPEPEADSPEPMDRQSPRRARTLPLAPHPRHCPGVGWLSAGLPEEGASALGAGWPKGSIELPAFPNGSIPPPALPKGSIPLPSFIQSRLTKAQASDSAPVKLSPDSPTPRDRCPGVAAASGPATRSSVRMRREGTRRRRGRVMSFSCPGGCAGRHHGRRIPPLCKKGASKDDRWSP